MIALWTYVNNPKNYRGFHLAADAAGCSELRAWLQRAADSKRPVAQKLSLSPTSRQQLEVVGFAGRARSFLSWTIECAPRKFADDYWKFIIAERNVTLRLGRTQLARLNRGIADIENGGGDYCIGADAEPLWFWWTVDAS